MTFPELTDLDLNAGGRSEQALRFRRQWALLTEADPVLAGWNTRHLPGGRLLAWHPEARVEFQEADGRVVAVMGLFLRPGGQPDYPFPEDILSKPERLAEHCLYATGAWAVLIVDQGSVNLFGDACGQVGLYYKGERVASSPLLIPGVERDVELDAEYPLGPRSTWYPAPLTPYRGVQVLLPNHLLSLPDGRLRRFWPTEPARDRAYPALLQEMRERLELSFSALLRAGPLSISITGGYDSRVNLSLARSVLDRVNFFTVRSPEVARCDLRAPEQLARRLGLTHRFLEQQPVPDAVYALYDELCGYSSVGDRRAIIGTLLPLLRKEQTLHLNGHLGAITTCYLWPEPRPREFDLAQFRARLPGSARVTAALGDWADTVAHHSVGHRWDLLYLEQNGGRWGSVGDLAAALFHENVSLFNDRYLLHRIFCVSARKRYRSRRLNRDLVKSLFPEAASVGYCVDTMRLKRLLPRKLVPALKVLASPFR